jgi:quercetin dioxygenase-like cupin family protein
MHSLKTPIVVVSISFLFLISCTDSPKAVDETKSDTTVTKDDVPAGPVYDSAMDPMVTAAAFTKKIADSLGIRIYETTFKPGDSLPMHSHTDHAFYLIDTSTAVLYVPGKDKGDTLRDMVPDSGWVMGPFNDAARNIGKTTIRFIEIPVHRPPGIEIPAKPAYDSSMDAFTLGGPSIRKIADSLGIKLFIVTMKPGDTATLHSHPDHAVYVLEGGELTVSFQGGPRTIMKLQKGIGFVGGPLSDAAKNTGKSTVKLLIAHVYRPRPK